MIIAILSALIIGLSLGLLGSGGAILTIPVLTYLFEQPEKLAIASSLIIIACIAMVSVAPAMMNKQVNWRLVLIFSLPSYLGTFAGVKLASLSDVWLQMLFFAVVTFTAGTKLIIQPKLRENIQPVYHKLIITGFMVGITTGFIGVGGGFLIVPALMLFAGCSIRQAVPVSLLIISGNALLGFWQYQAILAEYSLTLDWQIIITIALVGSLGGILAQPLSKRCPQALLSKVFGYILILISISIIIKNTHMFY
ncbi:sulfite exporter TauE/SafE family protein [Algibacillus agarilyticus]|uniref:sulfite exporter TauE/SafE family protein n=1 Tax=Algibacillus agarilyticus TaxID=2234133 RepID=UPI000DCF73C0|nr:sulfite exporter TauE/SafE family protein [Algibacillus agarilyticus]